MKSKLKKKINYLKYSSIFLKNRLFFVCLFINHKDFFIIRKKLIYKKFNLNFSKNKLLQNLFYFKNIKKFLTSRVFIVSKEKYDYSDFLFIKNLLFKKGYVILLSFNNKFYYYSKLVLLCNFLINPINKFSYLCSFYLLIKLGFFFKFYQLKNLN